MSVAEVAGWQVAGLKVAGSEECKSEFERWKVEGLNVADCGVAGSRFEGWKISEVGGNPPPVFAQECDSKAVTLRESARI